MLNVCNMRYRYKDKVIFENANLTVNRGEIVWLKGINGSGKTTLFKILSGLLEVEEIDIFLNNECIDIDKLRECITFIPNSPYLFEYLSGNENIEYLVSLFKLESCYDKIMENMNKLNLAEDLNKNICEYSLGMKIKLFLGTMIERDSSIFIIDELLANLDKEALDVIWEIIKTKVNIEEKSIIFSSHIDILNKINDCKVIHIRERGLEFIC